MENPKKIEKVTPGKVIVAEKPETLKKYETTAEALIAQAINQKVPVATMEKLLMMRREMKKEKAKEDFDLAMAKFQSECPIIQKTKEVHTNTGALGYKYAPIESIVDQVREALKKNGFSYTTNMKLLTDGVTVTVKVTHSGGHSELTEMSVPFGTRTNIMSQTQVVAAAQTFAKRYAFCNAFGILTGDEDTDARPVTPAPTSTPAKTTQTKTATPAKTTPPPQQGAPMSLPQLKYIEQLIKHGQMIKKDYSKATKAEASRLIDEALKIKPGTFNQPNDEDIPPEPGY